MLKFAGQFCKFEHFTKHVVDTGDLQCLPGLGELLGDLDEYFQSSAVYERDAGRV